MRIFIDGITIWLAYTVQSYRSGSISPKHEVAKRGISSGTLHVLRHPEIIALPSPLVFCWPVFTYCDLHIALTFSKAPISLAASSGVLTM